MPMLKPRINSFRFISLGSVVLAMCGALFFSRSFAAPKVTPVYAIQGSGDTTPLDGQIVTTEGVVIGDFQGNEELKGFFIQDSRGDGDAKTSDGIFVYVPMGNRLSKIDVKAGQRLRVTGTAVEYKGQTQIDDVTEITISDAGGVQSADSAPAPVDIRLPLEPGDNLERYEGMSVKFPDTLSVTGNYNLNTYGEVELAVGGRLFTPMNGNGHTSAENARRMILLDDGSAKRSPHPIPYLDEQNTRRVGDTVSNVTGVLAFAHDSYRLHPTQKPLFTRANPRPQYPELPAGGLKIATFNVHNYFTTLKSEKKSARGATTAEEFAVQSAKIVNAIKAINADVVALMEIENNGNKAVGDLVGKLNAAYATKTYDFVPDPKTGVGSDMIKCALIFKPGTVQRVGDSTSDAKEVYSRTPIAQTFQAPGGVKFTVVADHLKSKGGCPPSGDVDLGQGCWNGQRTLQSQALLQFVKRLQAESGDDDVLVLGDFNAYMEEDPIKTFKEGGLKVLNEMVPPAQRYSYQFKAHSGLLDYAFATPELSAQVAAITMWHINADEPELEAANGATPYRSSDHDPVIVALRPSRGTPVAVRKSEGAKRLALK